MRLRDEQRDCNSGEAPVLAGLGVESPEALCFHDRKVAPSSPHCWFLTFCVFPCITAQSMLAQMFVWMDTTLWKHNHCLLYCRLCLHAAQALGLAQKGECRRWERAHGTEGGLVLITGGYQTQIPKLGLCCSHQFLWPPCAGKCITRSSLPVSNALVFGYFQLFL